MENNDLKQIHSRNMGSDRRDQSPDHTERHPERFGIAGCVDVETTGLSPIVDEVVELAIILFSFDRHTGEILGIIDQYTGLREPNRDISSGAANVHRIALKELKGKTLDTPRVEQLIAKAEFLVAHNANFDRPFVEKVIPFVRGKRWFCSMDGIPWRSEGFPSKGLQRLLRAHRLPSGQAHRGADDALATIRLLSQRDRNGTHYFFRLINR